MKEKRKRETVDSAETAQTPSKFPGLDPLQYMSKEEAASGILKNPPLIGVDAALEELKVSVTTEFVEKVLKMSYGAGMEALRFFKWATWRLRGTKHTANAWNLLVDLLGKEKFFDAMWDCIKVMKAEGILSMETFSSVFGSYVSADRIGEATMTFEVMDKYGCPQDIVALNCLLSALCRYNQTKTAHDFFDSFKDRIKPDSDTFALLLKGWEKEANVERARHTFGEMILHVGWVTSNTSAYNAFLNTLINAYQAEEALKVLNVMKNRKCFADLECFSSVIHTLHQRRDTKNAYGFWEMLRQSGILPDTLTYNTMIDVFCCDNEFGSAYGLLDEMVFNGLFPNFKTYNTIFEALITKRRLEDASRIFREMTKNECYPVYANYVMAMKMYFEGDDPEMATTLWRHMILKGVNPKADCASVLIGGFCDLKRVSEAWRYCEEAIDRGIRVPSETMRKLKDVLVKEGKRETYNHLEMKVSNDGGLTTKSDPKNIVKEIKQPSQEVILIEQKQQKQNRKLIPLKEPPQQILKKLLENNMITLPKVKELYPSKSLPETFNPNEFCDYHRSQGHSTNLCFGLRHRIQDLIDSNQIQIAGESLIGKPKQ